MSANEGLNQILEKLDSADDESLDNFLDWDKEYNDLLSELDSIDLASLDGLVVTKTRTRVFRPFSIATPPPPTHHHHYHIFTESGSDAPPPKVRGFVSDRMGEARVDLTETLAGGGKARISRKRFTFKFAGDEPEERGNHVHHLHVHAGIRKEGEQTKPESVTEATTVAAITLFSTRATTTDSSSTTPVTTKSAAKLMKVDTTMVTTTSVVTSNLLSRNASETATTTESATVVIDTVISNTSRSSGLDEVILFETPIMANQEQNATVRGKELSGNRVKDAEAKKIEVVTVNSVPATKPPDMVIFEPQQTKDTQDNNSTLSTSTVAAIPDSSTTTATTLISTASTTVAALTEGATTTAFPTASSTLVVSTSNFSTGVGKLFYIQVRN